MTAKKTTIDRGGMSIVVDYETSAILAITRTQATASYVAEGIPNTFATNIPTDILQIKQRILERCDLRKDHIQLDYTRDEEGYVIYIKKLPTNLITDEYLRKCQLAKLRARHIYYQESFYRLFLSRVSIYPGNVGLGTTVAYNLLTSDPDAGLYSDGIAEYAEIMDMELPHAYQELKLLHESANITNMKYFAWYRKNIQAINQLHTEEEMTAYSKGVWAHLAESSSL